MCNGFQSNGRDRLRIRAFFVRFSGLDARKPLPESLTLLYLPRINGNALEVDGLKIRPDSKAFVTLHRVVAAKTKDGEVIFGSREPVRASEGVRFEVYSREEKVLKGIFRKDEGEEWKLECKCGLEGKAEVLCLEAEVYVTVEGHVAMNERVEMVVKRNKKNRSFGNLGVLEMIPEERKEGDESDGCCCSCGEVGDGGSDGGDLLEEVGVMEREREMEMEMEMEMEGVRWAVDMGICVMCFGMGYLVSKASAKSLRRLRIF